MKEERNAVSNGEELRLRFDDERFGGKLKISRRKVEAPCNSIEWVEGSIWKK